MRLPLLGLSSAAAVSNLGTGMTMLALPWFVLASTGRGTDTGLVVLAEALGLVLGTAFGGPWVDRLRPRRAAVAFDLAAAVVVVTIPMLHGADLLPLPALAVLALLLGLSRAPADSARQVLVPDIAARHGIPVERVTTAYDAPAQGSRALGAPLAGVLIAALGAPTVLYLDAASFVVSVLLVRLLLAEAAHAPAAGAGYLRQLVDGFRFLRRDRLLSAIVLLVVVTNGLNAGFFTVLLPAYGQRVLHSALGVGLVTGIGGAAMIAGSVLYSWLGLGLRRWTVFAVCELLLFAPRMGIFLLQPPLAVLVAVTAVAGLAFGPGNPIIHAAKAERTPPEMRARVFGAMTAGAFLGMPLGTGLAGVLLDAIGLLPAMFAFTVVATLMSLCPLVFPAFKLVDRPAPEPVTAAAGT